MCAEQCTAARIVLQAPRRSHTRPFLRQLHWLPVHHRNDYRLVVMTYHICRSTTSDIYLTSTCTSRQVSYAYWMFHCLTDLLSEQNLLSLLSSILHRLCTTRYYMELRLATQIVNSNSLTTFRSRIYSHFLPRCRKCRRGLAMRILSVCLSDTCIVTKRKRNMS